MTAELYTAIPLAMERVRDAKNTNIGMTVWQWCPIGTTVGDFDTAASGWRTGGILDGEFVDDSTKVNYMAEPGSVGVTLGVTSTKETISKTFSFIATSKKLEALAYCQNDPTFTAPTTANASTVDADPVVPTSTVLTLAAVSGSGTTFAVGDWVKIATGTGDSLNTDYAQVTAVDTTAKTITITPPLDVLPVDGAAVTVTGNLALTKTAGTLPSQIRVRLIKYNNDEQSATIIAYPAFQVTDGKLSTGDGQNPAKCELTGMVIAERNTGLGKYVLSRRKTVFKA